MNTHLTRLVFLFIFSAIANITTAQSTDIPGPSGSERFGTSVTILANGNYVVADPYYDEGAISNVGAVYLYNGSTHTVISTLKGSTTDNLVGSSGIIALPNSSYLVQSWAWDNGATLNVGAITWVNGTTGINGVVSSGNSLIGSQNGDLSGARIEILTNGNYVVSTPYWSNGAVTQAGAVTWGSGTTGRSGVVGASISLVGTQFAESLGFGSVAVLTNGNYVVGDPLWNGGFGAAVWCNGTTGRTGTISAGIALVGSSVNHFVGGATALSNGNYVVSSVNWDNGATANVGAITWGNGTTGTTGTVSSANSFIGSKADDQVGSSGIIALNNGNYIIVSPYCDNGAIVDAGAVTWRNGTGSTSGTVSSSNSLMGGSTNDNIGSERVTPLNNGNYVVSSSLWDNGATTDAGAVTWGNGTTGTSGVVNSSNSLVGTSNNDNIGSGTVYALSNGNYVIASRNWDNGAIVDAGAATWGNGTSGTTGTISIANSLVGNTISDNVASGGIIALTNGNYVVPSPLWDNGATANVGAVTWCDGTVATATSVTASNSLIGSITDDNIASFGVTALANGNYVIKSNNWDNGALVDAGAVTWCKGALTTSGVVSTGNSLVGSSSNDYVGFGGVTALTNGNYIVRSTNWDNGASANSGAVTFCNGSTGLAATVTTCNSVLGSAANGGSQMVFGYNYTYNYMAVGRRSDNIVTIFDPTGMLLANTLDQQTVNINGSNTVPLIASTACRIIGIITPNGASPVSGFVTAKVWVETSVPTYGVDPFVARHYEITPAANTASATGRITLYFTQQEFTDFNDHPASALDLPIGPSDLIGIANLRVGKFGGVSNNGSGLPGTYPGAATLINPLDVDIVWKNSLSRWEVSFDVTGFSGFIVQTKTTALPLTLLEFNGHLNNNNSILNWKTTGEFNTTSFDIERSTDGRNYFVISSIAAINQPGINLYTYTDNNINSFGVSVVYYRIKQKDANNRFTYSGIVALSIDKYQDIVLFYPNPVITNASLTVNINRPEQFVLKIFDNTGRLLKQQQLKLSTGSNVLPVDVKNLAKGIYFLEVKGETINEHRSFVKQ